jgi:Holliday junction resolvasome RuvABC ATP-dependent DNA helicase subunit
MLKGLFKKLNLLESRPSSSIEERFFHSIYGYEDIKKLLVRCMESKDSVHVLLAGPPASGKTLLLLEIMKKLNTKCYFFDGTATSGPGLIDYLFAHHDISYILIDEIDKMKESDQTVLLGLMETGMLVSTKVRKTASIKMNKVKVFATSNSLDRLSEPLKSRFSIFRLPEYTYQQFEEIAARILRERYNIPPITATKIAAGVWYEMKSKDIRDVLKIGKLAKPDDEDIQWLIETHRRYSLLYNESKG